MSNPDTNATTRDVPDFCNKIIINEMYSKRCILFSIYSMIAKTQTSN